MVIARSSAVSWFLLCGLLLSGYPAVWKVGTLSKPWRVWTHWWCLSCILECALLSGAAKLKRGQSMKAQPGLVDKSPSLLRESLWAMQSPQCTKRCRRLPFYMPTGKVYRHQGAEFMVSSKVIFTHKVAATTRWLELECSKHSLNMSLLSCCCLKHILIWLIQRLALFDLEVYCMYLHIAYESAAEVVMLPTFSTHFLSLIKTVNSTQWSALTKLLGLRAQGGQYPVRMYLSSIKA